MFLIGSGNCRITHPNREILLLWYEIGKFKFSGILYTHFVFIHRYVHTEREKEGNDVMTTRSTEL